MEKCRDNTVDILKGFAILCVVIGHLNPISFVHNFIYSFHMPLFMFCSGITFWYSFGKKTQNREWANKEILFYILKRFIALIIPFITWCYLKYICEANNYNIISAIQKNFNSYWFLPTLFCIILLFCLYLLIVFNLNKNNSIIIDICFILIALGLNVLLIKLSGLKLFRQVVIYVIPFYCGYSVKKYDIINRIVQTNIFVTICLLAYCFLFRFYQVENNSLISLGSRFILGLAFTFVLYNFLNAKKINTEAFISRNLILFGQSSMSIYLVQEFFRNTMPTSFIPEKCIGGGWEYMIIILVVSVLICYISILINRLVSLSKYLGLILFGR